MHNSGDLKKSLNSFKKNYKNTHTLPLLAPYFPAPRPGAHPLLESPLSELTNTNVHPTGWICSLPSSPNVWHTPSDAPDAPTLTLALSLLRPCPALKPHQCGGPALPSTPTPMSSSLTLTEYLPCTNIIITTRHGVFHSNSQPCKVSAITGSTLQMKKLSHQ